MPPKEIEVTLPPFICRGFSPMTEAHIRTVLIRWMSERGLFEKVEGRPEVEIKAHNNAPVS